MLQKSAQLDARDPLKKYRDSFHFPKTTDGNDFLYFCGNSLGLQSKYTQNSIETELNKWKDFGVEGHFELPKPWLSYHNFFEEQMGRLTGAEVGETVTMNALTVNLNLLLLSFYNPTKERFKILMEKNAFPSDHYAVQSQVDLLHKKGVLSKEQAETAIVYLQPDEWGVYNTDEILNQISQEGVCLLLLSGVNYQTGEVFELEKISSHCKTSDVVCGLDLAHAVGNVPLKLHDWEVDFAVWCTYKYLNGGPGSVGGAFVHQKHHNSELPRLHGWWSNVESNRFEMKSTIEPYQSAEAWQMSNAPVLSMASLLGSLEVFSQVNLEEYYQKGQALSAFLAELILEQLPQLTVITPLDRKGCQLSIFIPGKGKDFIEQLNAQGAIADWRNHPKGGILRVAPVPLYNSFDDVAQLVQKLKTLV